MDLVTGGTGIVGAHVLLALTANGRAVRALVRHEGDRGTVARIFRHYRPDAEDLLGRITWVKGDLLDVGSLADAMEGVQHVYHAAALVSFDPRKARELYRVNVIGTAHVVNSALAAGVERLCHVSSTAAIGKGAPNEVYTEDLPWTDDSTTSDYSRSKYEAELEIHRGIAEGLDAVMVNPCVILGPGASGRSSMALMERIRAGTRFHTSGSNAFVDARDVADCMVRLMEKGATGERYLLVGTNAGYRTLFTAAARAFGVREPQQAAPAWLLGIAWRLERVRSWLTGSSPLVTKATVHSSLAQRSYSNAKVIALLGYRFRTLEESLDNVSAFMRGS